jgi:hypothetical protein
MVRCKKGCKLTKDKYGCQRCTNCKNDLPVCRVGFERIGGNCVCKSWFVSPSMRFVLWIFFTAAAAIALRTKIHEIRTCALGGW